MVTGCCILGIAPVARCPLESGVGVWKVTADGPALTSTISQRSMLRYHRAAASRLLVAPVRVSVFPLGTGYPESTTSAGMYLFRSV